MSTAAVVNFYSPRDLVPVRKTTSFTELPKPAT